jgi:hypothetical protein
MAGFMVHMIGDEVRPIVVCTATATARPHSLSAWPSSLSGESQTYVIRWFQLIPRLVKMPRTRGRQSNPNSKACVPAIA